MKSEKIWLTHQINNILIVEDESDTMGVLTYALKSFLEDDIKLYQAGGCQEAIGISHRVDLDLAIIDYKLPDGSGIELIKEIKKQNNLLPVLMITGYGNTVKEDALDSGVNVFLDKPIELTEFLTLSRNLLSLSRTRKRLVDAENMITALNRAIEVRDVYTEGHSARVAAYSLIIFDNANIGNGDKREALHMGCILHDIGKIGIPDKILKSNKTPLSSSEYDVIKQHPTKGYDICKDLNSLKLSLPIIKHHHEKLDGSGYPDGLVEKEITEIVQISTIADIYDALTSDRSYRNLNSPKEAIDIMQKEVDEGKLNKDFFDILKFKMI